MRILLALMTALLIGSAAAAEKPRVLVLTAYPQGVWTVDAVSAATGLGGRARRLGDETERARKTVSARVRGWHDGLRLEIRRGCDAVDLPLYYLAHPTHPV